MMDESNIVHKMKEFYLTPMEFAIKHNVTRWAVYKWIRFGRIINYVKYKERYYISGDEDKPLDLRKYAK